MFWWWLSSSMDATVTSWCSGEKSGIPGRNGETTSNSSTTSSLVIQSILSKHQLFLQQPVSILQDPVRLVVQRNKMLLSLRKTILGFLLASGFDFNLIWFFFEFLTMQCSAPHTFVAIKNVPLAKWNASFRFMTRTLGSCPTTSDTSWWWKHHETPLFESQEVVD